MKIIIIDELESSKHFSLLNKIAKELEIPIITAIQKKKSLEDYKDELSIDNLKPIPSYYSDYFKKILNSEKGINEISERMNDFLPDDWKKNESAPSAFQILSFYHKPTSNISCKYITVKPTSDYWKRAINGDKDFAILSVKRLSDGEVFTISDKCTPVWNDYRYHEIKSICVIDGVVYLLNEREQKIELGNAVKLKEELENKDYTILLWQHKEKLHLYTKTHREGYDYKNDWNIYEVKRNSDGEVFRIGDKIQSEKGSSDNGIITGFSTHDIHKQKSITPLSDILKERFSSGLLVLIEKGKCNDLSKIEHFKEKKEEKKKIGTTEDGKDWFFDDQVYWVDNTLKIFGPDIFNYPVDYMKYFLTSKAAQDYVSGKQPLVTEDNEHAYSGDTVYGIAIQASGNDVWSTQTLPFNVGLCKSNRKWFKDPVKANKYLIANYPCLSISDLAKLWDYGMKKEDLTDLVKSKIGGKNA